MATDNNALNTIAKGTVLEGKIITKGDIRVEGKVVGTLICDSKLVIGEHGSIEGTVDARNAYVAGHLKGRLVVRELLQLQEKGHIEGDIFTQKLSVQVGAIFTGNCKMGQDVKSLATEGNGSASAIPNKPESNGASRQEQKPSLVNE